MTYEKRIRMIKDFPKQGIMYADITPLLSHKEDFGFLMNDMYHIFKDKQIDYVVGIESRGFIFGSILANHLGAGFVPIRKAGKLPHRCISKTYSLEYGKDKLEMHEDAFPKGARVLIVDDVLATGGTACAAVDMVRRLGGAIVDCCFIIEIDGLPGRYRLEKEEVTVKSIMSF